MRGRQGYEQFISYRRVSTTSQGEEGIGLELQRVAIDAFARARGATIVEDYHDVVSARGDQLKRNDGLKKALEHAARTGIPLIVDTFCRFSRDTASFERICLEYPVSIVVARGDGISLEAASLVSAAARAEEEGRLISERTREALRIKKEAGVRLGNTKNLAVAQKLGGQANKDRAEAKVEEIAGALENAGLFEITAPDAVQFLNDQGIPTNRGGLWTLPAIQRPLRAARKILHGRSRAVVEGNPNYGRF